MAAKDIYHDEVVNALVQDGWVITDDPYIISVGQKRVFIDLGAERLLAAQRNIVTFDPKKEQIVRWIT